MLLPVWSQAFGLSLAEVGVLKETFSAGMAALQVPAGVLAERWGERLPLALNGTASVLYGSVGDFVAGDRQSRAFGLFYTLGVGASAVAPALYGLLSDRGGVALALAAIAAAILLTLPLCPMLSLSLGRLRATDHAPDS